MVSDKESKTVTFSVIFFSLTKVAAEPFFLNNFWSATRDECYEVSQLVEALRYKPEGRGFDSRWGRLDF